MTDDQDQTEDQKDQDGTQDQDQKDQDQDGTQDSGEKDQKDQDQKDLDPEVKRAQRRRDAALTRAQKAEEEAKRLREKYEPKEQDPETKANRKLVRAEYKVVAAKAGVADEDLKDLADYLDLDSVSVDGDGEVDSDAIQERLEKLVSIVGKLTKGRDQRRVPRTDTRDRGGERAQPKDAAAKRRQDMLNGR